MGQKVINLHFHDLRHTSASMLIVKEIDLTTVKVLLGHNSRKMTLRSAHLAPEYMGNTVTMFITSS